MSTEGVIAWNDHRLSASSIPTAAFETVRRGFDPPEVRAYLQAVAAYVGRLEARIKELETRLREHDGQPGVSEQDPYDRLASHMAEVMRTFDQEIDGLRSRAEVDARRIMAEAKADAERVQSEAEKLSGEAEEEAGRVVAQAKAEAERIMRDAESAAGEVRAAADRTIRNAEAHARWLFSAQRREGLLGDLRTSRERLLEMAASLDAMYGQLSSSSEDVVVVEDAAER